MARGFGTTFGTGATDKIAGGTGITVGTTLSIAAWINRHGTGGGRSGHHSGDRRRHALP